MKAILETFVSIASGLMRALALMLCWNWLIVKAWHAPVIGFAMAWSASFIWGVMDLGLAVALIKGDEDKGPIKPWMKSVICALVLYPLIIGIAWIASHFI